MVLDKHTIIGFVCVGKTTFGNDFVLFLFRG